jgi:colanic acid/amylovoran biosynthesis glycosyltransferase
MPLRVLHAVDQLGQRSETFVYTVITHHVDFVPSVLCHSRAHADEFPFADVHVHPRPRSRRTVDWWLAASIERAGGRSRWRRAVDGVLARVAPDVIHAHFGPIGCELAPVAAAARIPLVTSLYGVDAAVLPYLPHWRAAYARLFRHGDRFLAEGPEMRKKVIAAGAPTPRTAIQPIAIDVARYPRWAPADPPTIAFVGRFVEKKGLPDALAAFARAHARLAGARFVVVGGGAGEQEAREAADRLDIAARVDFVGMRSHAEVTALLATTRALIHPSVTAADGDSEGGAPTILLEAQAIGTPIVATRHADIPNVVPDGPGVYLRDEHDVAGLADALALAFDDRQRVDGAYVAAHHDITAAMPRLERHYRDAMALRARAAAV